MLTVKEVADRTRYTEQTIRAKIKAGALPAVRRGRAWMINESDVTLLFENGE